MKARLGAAGHDLAELDALCDRGLLLEEGTVGPTGRCAMSQSYDGGTRALTAR